MTEQFMPDLGQLAARGFDEQRYGDIPRWQTSLNKLPPANPSVVNLNQPTIQIGCSTDLSPQDQLQLIQSLKELHPWRKGPFDFFGIHINTEWRSDWKWDRLIRHIEPLEGKNILDVGCGSGYHCWRMRGAGAKEVLGIEPTPLFVMQFHAAQKYIQDPHVQVLPLRIEDLPTDLEAFHSTFSMGILYHRRSPMDHLLELKGTLVTGGQLILETLIIEGKLGEVLVPEGRYGKMGNVWFIPTPLTLESWLKKTGYSDITCVDITPTTTEEQRSTEWMTFQSLADFLDPDAKDRTIEGHPRPTRAIFTARKKS